MKVFHHNDLDGYASGAVVAKYRNNYNEEDFFEVDYVMTLPLEKVANKEEVWFVDYSFTEKTKYVLDTLIEKECKIFWIDHHTSSMDFLAKYPEYKKIAGYRQEGISGAALTYMWCFDLFFEELPMAIKYVSDYDCWQFNYGEETEHFKYGMESVCQKPLSSIWVCLLNDDEKERERELNFVLNRGRLIYAFEENQNTYYRENFWYETTLEGFKDESLNGIKAAVINKRSNSKIFGHLYEEYPLVIAWVFNGERYIYSFFAKKGGANCKKIAEELGGGGHIGAAGCNLDYLRFKKN